MGFFDYDGADATYVASGLLAPEATFWPNRSSSDWRRFLDATQTVRYSPGDPVLNVGQTNRSVFLVLSGEAVDPTGIRWVEGQVIGIDSFFAGMAPATTINAASELEVARFTDRALDAIAARDAPLALAITRELARLLAIECR